MRLIIVRHRHRIVYQENINSDGATHLMKIEICGFFYKRYWCYAPLKIITMNFLNRILRGGTFFLIFTHKNHFMKKTLTILTLFCLFSLPHDAHAIVYSLSHGLVQDSLKVTNTSKGDKIANWGQKSTTTGVILFTLFVLLLLAIEFEMRGGFLLLLLYGSFIFGLILGILGLILCVTALSKKDTSLVGRKKARTGLFVLLFGALLNIILLLAVNR